MRKIKSILLIIIDIFMINMGFLFAINLTYTGYFSEVVGEYANNSVIITGIFIATLFAFRMYRSLWDYTGTDEVLHGVAACVVASGITYIYARIASISIPLNTIILAFICVSGSILAIRVFYRVYRRALLNVANDKGREINVMIVGAGYAGTMLINEMLSKSDFKYKPVLLVDDDPYKRGKRISGIKIMGNRSEIPALCEKYEIDLILIAIQNISNDEKGEILDICKKTNVKLKLVPGMYELINGDVNVTKIKDVEIEDLLGRDQIQLDSKNISGYLEQRTVLVTGGGGSIGSELCRQIINFSPRRIIIFDIYENNAYDIQNELKALGSNTEIITLIGSIRDEKRLEELFSKYSIDVVFHAAAHKHVPLMEHSPKEAVKNNIIGTYKLANMVHKYKVKKFVLISTDKAVNPTNIMGATKRMCEMIVQGMNKISSTEYVAVRFGNVLGSNGSVIPLFKRQIEAGGPVTVTHKNITRYFMLIPEAAQLVLQAGAFAKGGEIFVLDMGKPVRIYDLAVDLIKLSGLEVGKDIKIEVTGLRPGEKLYEELLMSEEGLSNTSHNKIYIGKPSNIDINEIKEYIDHFEKLVVYGDNEDVRDYVQKVVPTYHPCLNEEVAIASKDQE